MRICVINLRRSVDRRAAMENQLRRLGLTFTIHEAVDGRALDIHQIPNYDRKRRLRLWGSDLTHGEIGAYLSHVDALETAAHAGEPRTLVLEDDAALSPDLPEILRFLRGLGESFEFVRLSGGRVPSHVHLLDTATGRRLVRLTDVASGASAYVVNRAGAAKLIGAVKSIFWQIDVTIDRYWDHGLRMFALLPYPVRTLSEFPSDIGPRPNVWELPGMRHWRLRTRLLRFPDSARKRAKNIEIRLEMLRPLLLGRRGS